MKTKIHYPKGFPGFLRFFLIMLMISVACLVYKVFGSEPEKKTKSTLFSDYCVAETVPALEAWMFDLSLFCMPGELSLWLAEKEEEASCSQLEPWMFDFSFNKGETACKLEYWMIDPVAFKSRMKNNNSD